MEKSSKIFSKAEQTTGEKKKINFKENLQELFDITHGNVFETIKIEKDAAFHISQRKKKGRIDSLRGTDKRSAEKEERTQKCLNEEVQRTKLNKDTKMI